MGQDTIAKQYMSDNEKFADAFNYFLYGGKQIIMPENLREREVGEIHSELLSKSESASIQKRRDILKQCIVKRDERNTYVLLGIENQSAVHYAMPVRNYLYDALNYSTQLEWITKQHRRDKDLKGQEYLSGFSRGDKLLPVITLVMYFGAGEWDGPRTLHEMLEINDPLLEKFVNDYKLNIIIPSEIKDTEKFHSDLGRVIDFIRVSDDRKKMQAMLTENGEEFSKMDLETVMLLNECVNAKIVPKEERGVVNVCKAWDDMAKEVEKQTKEKMCKAWEDQAKEIEEQTKAKMCKAWEDQAKEIEEQTKAKMCKEFEERTREIEEQTKAKMCKAWEDQAKKIEEQTKAKVRREFEERQKEAEFRRKIAEKEEKIETAKRLLEQSVDISIISLATGLTEEEIEKSSLVSFL